MTKQRPTTQYLFQDTYSNAAILALARETIDNQLGILIVYPHISVYISKATMFEVTAD